MKDKRSGFTLIELMIVVVIIGILAALAVPRYMRAATRAKQSEAKGILKQVYTTQRAYFVEHEAYCRNGVVASKDAPLAFAPLLVEIMPSARYTYTMIVNGNEFSCIATANLDEDATVDTWVIDNTGVLTCVADDSRQ